MHYYKRNLGDYAKKAGRLSMLQHGSYTLLIDSCYDREEFPTLEQAIDWTWASTTEEIEAVKFVLGRFFELIDGVYVQPRIKEELDAYHEKAEKNKRIAIERETKRKESSTKRAQVVNEPPPNQEPRTKNQEPKEIPAADKSAPGVARKIPNDWMPNKNSVEMIDGYGIDFNDAKPAIDDFVRWAKESEKKQKNWDLAFQRNPVVKSTLAKISRGQKNETHQKPRKLSVGERATEHRKRAERLWADEAASRSVGEDDTHLRPPLDVEFRRVGNK